MGSTVQGVAKSRTQLNDFTFFSFFLSLIFGLKKHTHNKLEDITKKKQTHRCREQTSGYQWGEGRGRGNTGEWV